MFKKHILTTALIVGLSCVSGISHAELITGIAVEHGFGEQGTSVNRFALQSDWNQNWFASNNTHINGYWDLSIAQWRLHDYKGIPGNDKNIYDIGFTPVFRFESLDKKGLYAEAGIGIHLMSHLYNNKNRQFSTAFQFGDHIGVGYVFNNNLDLGLRLQHVSNGSIKEPNPGENFIVLRAAYLF